MQAAFLVRNGSADKAFELREAPIPAPAPHEVLIKVEAFGLNFADVMARLGHYRDAPPLPAIIGYDVCGRIESVGSAVKNRKAGQRVAALTRFGGYAQYATTDARGTVVIPEDMPVGEALALPTQYGTAFYMTADFAQIHEGDHVLIHAAAGGVGTALVQWAVHRGCIIYGTAGSEEKLKYLETLGVQYPINYRKVDFADEIRRINPNGGMDMIFDPVGGKSVKKGVKLLRAGGRIVVFGASSMTQTKNIFGKIGVALGFGFYHPVGLISNSRSLMTTNMLYVGDQRPEVLERVFGKVSEYTQKGVFKPTVGGEFHIDNLAEAHTFLESRKSIGKIAVNW